MWLRPRPIALFVNVAGDVAADLKQVFGLEVAY